MQLQFSQLKLESNTDKAARNLKKHGVSFDDAKLVFFDSGRIETYDRREDSEVAGQQSGWLTWLFSMSLTRFELKQQSA